MIDAVVAGCRTLSRSLGVSPNVRERLIGQMSASRITDAQHGPGPHRTYMASPSSRHRQARSGPGSAELRRCAWARTPHAQSGRFDWRRPVSLWAPQDNLLLSDGAHRPYQVAMLPTSASLSQADGRITDPQGIHRGGRRVLLALLGVQDFLPWPSGSTRLHAAG